MENLSLQQLADLLALLNVKDLNTLTTLLYEQYNLQLRLTVDTWNIESKINKTINV